MEPYNACLTAVAILLYRIMRGLRLVNKVRIEDVELVSLHNLRRRVIMIIVGLIVLVPLVSGVNTVEIFRLSRSVLVMPPVYLHPHLFHQILHKDLGDVPHYNFIFP